MAYSEEINTQEVLAAVPESGLVKLKWLKVYLKLTSNNLATYKTRGVKPDEKGWWNLREVCQFILSGGKGQTRQDRKAIAAEILKKMKGISTDLVGTSLVFESMDEGLEGSLSRARQMEKHVSMQAQEMADDPILLANFLKTWKDMQDVLRKHESESLTILERQETLVPKDYIHEFFNRKITPTVSKMMALPEQIIDEIMEQDDRTVVIEIMEKAIHKALEEISQKMNLPHEMEALEALEFFQKLKVLPKEKITHFDLCMTPDVADVVYNIVGDEKEYGGDLQFSVEQQDMVLEFFGVEIFNVFQINISAWENKVLVDLTISPESKK